MCDENGVSQKKLTDDELVGLAIGSGELTAQGRRRLVKELDGRQLGLTLLPALRSHIEPLSELELETLIALVQRLPCPVCGNRYTQLNGFVIERKNLDLIAFYEVEAYLYIACQPCLTKEGHPTSPRLGPEDDWMPSESFAVFVEDHAPMLSHYRERPDLIHALMKLDYDTFLHRIDHPDQELIAQLEAVAAPDVSSHHGDLRETQSEDEARRWHDALRATGIRCVVSEHQAGGGRAVVYRLSVSAEHRAMAESIIDNDGSQSSEGFCFYCGADVAERVTQCPECGGDLSDD